MIRPDSVISLISSEREWIKIMRDQEGDNYFIEMWIGENKGKIRKYDEE